MLSEAFKKRINATTSVKDLESEIRVMKRILEQSIEEEIKKEMAEKISYAVERQKLLRQDLRK